MTSAKAIADVPLAAGWLAILIAGLAATGPFSTDVYLPAFRAIETSLHATQLEVQQTLTAFMVTYGFMTLWHGALADRFGRRAVLIASTLLFAMSSALCALAPSIEWLWVGRALQGLCGGTGLVVGRAVVRELFDGAAAQRLLSQVMVIFGVAPAVAPLIGGGLLAAGGWRSIFVFLAIFGVAVAYWSWRHLPETLVPHARQPLHPIVLVRAYGAVLGHPGFLLIAIAGAFTFNAFFLYVLSAPAFLMTNLGLGSGDFGWLFIPMMAGMMMGSMLSGEVAGRWSPGHSIAVGFAIMSAAATANILLAALLPPMLPWAVMPIPVFTFGMALAMPALTLRALDHFPDRRGLASSCQGVLQVGLSAITAGLLAPLMWSSALGLALGMGSFLAAALLGYVAYQRFFSLPDKKPI
jgi:MFS transporter, DHA1 family, multidrug resistance protein